MWSLSPPRSFRLLSEMEHENNITMLATAATTTNGAPPPHSSHPAMGYLILLVFEAVLEVVCVSLPGYIVARQGMFDADAQKFLANLNVQLFTPCLIFTKLASQLNAQKLVELAVIPVIFIVQTAVSYLCSVGISRGFRLEKRARNFVVAMGVFGNSNSLPISLVISLSQTISGLHWDRIPGDNDDEVGARGILYLLIFQQLGQLLRWSWGYHVLLAPKDSYEEEQDALESGESERYQDDPEGSHDEEHAEQGLRPDALVDTSDPRYHSRPTSVFESGSQTPINQRDYPSSVSSSDGSPTTHKHRGRTTTKHVQEPVPPEVLPTPANGNMLPPSSDGSHITSFPQIRTPSETMRDDAVGSVKRRLATIQQTLQKARSRLSQLLVRGFHSLPNSTQKHLHAVSRFTTRFGHGVWDFMNPPLWAMLVAIIVASVPSLQQTFFTEGTFIQNSVTRAVSQSGNVAVPLILVVLGANLARNTLPREQQTPNTDSEGKMETRILVAALVSRMLLPTIIMAPMLALAAKYVPVSILDDPIFVIVCFLLTGAPSALQLAQICQINGVFEGVMSKLLFQSYVIWILPSTLVLVMCALEVVEWANA